MHKPLAWRCTHWTAFPKFASNLWPREENDRSRTKFPFGQTRFLVDCANRPNFFVAPNKYLFSQLKNLFARICKQGWWSYVGVNVRQWNVKDTLGHWHHAILCFALFSAWLHGITNAVTEWKYKCHSGKAPGITRATKKLWIKKIRFCSWYNIWRPLVNIKLHYVGIQRSLRILRKSFNSIPIDLRSNWDFQPDVAANVGPIFPPFYLYNYLLVFIHL